ncbi:MAG: N-acyl homoserine lactonase family protein [Kribbellaceae bacterium]|nr:N-acyl homoserine lactonase family protein [Kribbellaceae bacterium]
MSTEATKLSARAGSGDPVRAVSVISTGSVEIRPEHALGTRKPLYWWLMTSRRWLPPRPINVYVVEHTNGLVLFDTGQDRASVTDPSYFPGGLTGVVYSRLARFDIAADETLDAQLGTLGYAAGDVDTAVISHLHQDHIGGISQLRGERLVSPAEWAELSGFSPEARGFLRSHIDVPGRRWKHVQFSPIDDLAPFTEGFDVMGDGSIVLLPTPGHTPGSMSMLIRRRDLPPLLMVGDLTYEAALLERRQLPGVGARTELGRTTDKVLALAERLPGLVILPAHDPTAAPRLINASRRPA